MRANFQRPLLGGLLLSLLALTGCATMVSYTPQPLGPQQNLRYAQGVGTLSIKDNEQEVFMHSTYRVQGAATPTFTIGYANGGETEANFGPENIKAYFRGAPVAIYTYEERIAEIEAQKQAQQVALAIVGGIAAGAAAYNVSRSSYTSHSSRLLRTPLRTTAFARTRTTRIYDPAAGILVGAGLIGATAVGVRQIDQNARAQGQAASNLLQANTLLPLEMASGDIVLRDCCDPFVKPGDLVRFEVTVRDRTYVFDFLRRQSGK